MTSLNDQIQQDKNDEAVIVGLLHDYVDKHFCPCDWKQFEYWVSKEHSSGWHDEYQNILAEAAVSLPCFEHTTNESGFDIRVVCKCCGRKWHYTSSEWRMLAYRNRLVPDNPRAFEFDLMVGRVFATAGFEPTSTTSLSISQWYEFMSGKPYISKIPYGGKRISLLNRIWGTICGRT